MADELVKKRITEYTTEVTADDLDNSDVIFVDSTQHGTRKLRLKGIRDTVDNVKNEGIKSSGVSVTADNYATTITNVDNQPVNTIYVYAAGLQSSITNLPSNVALNIMHYTYKYSVATNVGQVMIAIERSGDNPAMYFRTTAGTPVSWGSWVKVANSADVEAIREELDNLDIETDTTLSISGKPADAKAAGDAINDLKADLEMEDGHPWAGAAPSFTNYSYAGVGTLDGYKLTLSQGDVVSGSSARVGCTVLYNSEDFVGKKLILKPHFTINGDSSAFVLNVIKQANNDGVYTTLVQSLTDPEIELDFTNATFNGLRYNYMYFFLQGIGVALAEDTVVEYIGCEIYDTSGNVRSVRLDQMENEIESLNNWVTNGLTVNLIQSIESNTYYRYSDGAKVAGGNYLSSTGLIPVTEGKTYTMNTLAGTQPHWTCWNAGGTFVTGSQSSGYSYTIPTGQNIKFLRASFLMANEATVMIVEGADVDYNNYYPYGHPAKYAKSQWYGKKAAMIGDSLTQMGYWEPMLASILGLSAYSIIAQYGGNMTAIANYVSQLDSDIDVLTVWAGTNDFANGITLGEFGSIDTNTYAGALQHVIDYCGQHYPLMKILLITPMQRFDSDVSSWSKDASGAYINPTTNKTLEDYANMVKTYGANYAIPVLDMYHSSGFNQYNASAYSADLLHPSRPGFQRLCWKIIEAAKAI